MRVRANWPWCRLALVGGAIGAGLNIFGGFGEVQRVRSAGRFVAGLLVGGVGGAFGGYAGDIWFSVYRLPRAFGWMLLGAGIGVAVGRNERSFAKFCISLLGGSFGGLVGGFLFDPILVLIPSDSGVGSRAAAFAVLGMCIGLAIGLVKSLSWKPRFVDPADPSTQPVN